MKKLSETYKELGIAFSFPIEIKNSNGKQTYYEESYGYWDKREYDSDGNKTYFENSHRYWHKREYDSNGKETYFEDSYGYKEGTKRSSCDGKVIEVDGKKCKLTELWYNSSMNKITYEEYQRMWFALQYGIINEQEWREFCDAVFAQTLEENKDVMIRLKYS